MAWLLCAPRNSWIDEGMWYEPPKEKSTAMTLILTLTDEKGGY